MSYSPALAMVSVMLISIGLGCAPQSNVNMAQLDSSPPRNVGRWLPSVSQFQAQNFDPDTAKAVLIARAAIEQSASDAHGPRPEIAELRPIDEGDRGWSVYVRYGGLQPAGSFSAVSISKDWKTVHIQGGA